MFLGSCFLARDISTYSVNLNLNHYCAKSFSGPYFPAFGPKMERYGVSLCIQPKCGKIRTRKSPNTDTFSAVHISVIYSHQLFVACDFLNVLFLESFPKNAKIKTDKFIIFTLCIFQANFHCYC